MLRLELRCYEIAQESAGAMACYHFTLKLDRCPDNMLIEAANHLDYISVIAELICYTVTMEG